MTTDEPVGLPRIRISDRVLKAAFASAVTASPNELGGILVGWWEGRNGAVVSGLLPVDDDTAGHSDYERRHAPAQLALDEHLMTAMESRIGYVGEWHSHPAPQPPSAVDRTALREITRQARRSIALVVLALAPDGVGTPHGLIGMPQKGPRRGRINIVDAPIERTAR